MIGRADESVRPILGLALLFLAPDGNGWILHVNVVGEWISITNTEHAKVARGIAELEANRELIIPAGKKREAPAVARRRFLDRMASYCRWVGAIQGALAEMLDRGMTRDELCCVGMDAQCAARIDSSHLWPPSIQPWVDAIRAGQGLPVHEFTWRPSYPDEIRRLREILPTERKVDIQVSVLSAVRGGLLPMAATAYIAEEDRDGTA